MNRDPLGEAGGINLYGFVGNDPVNFVDPTGLVKFKVKGIVGLNATVKASIAGIKVSAKLDGGSSHYPLGGAEYVSQGVKLSGKIGPVTLGAGAERTAPGSPHGYQRDYLNRPIPGTGNSINDILSGRKWDPLLGLKIGKWELTKLKIEAVFLLGFSLEVDFGGDLEKFWEWLKKNGSCP